MLFIFIFDSIEYLSVCNALAIKNIQVVSMYIYNSFANNDASFDR